MSERPWISPGRPPWADRTQPRPRWWHGLQHLATAYPAGTLRPNPKGTP